MNQHPSVPTVSVCIIAYNEEVMLGDCLASVAFADQIVVVDTGGTDQTVDIARKAGATVVEFDWTDDFSAARNVCLSHATGDWILVLDSDERLAPGADAIIRQAITFDTFDCGLLPIHNASHIAATPEQILSGMARRNDPILLARLFRRTPDLQWEGVVHENVTEWLTKGRKTKAIDANIVHFGNVPRIRTERGKSKRNLRLLERRCILEPHNPIARTRLARELLRQMKRVVRSKNCGPGWTFA